MSSVVQGFAGQESSFLSAFNALLQDRNFSSLIRGGATGGCGGVSKQYLLEKGTVFAKVTKKM